ncbi:ATP-grasp domain-containing protein [Sphaerisporangium aureirubrum]|uniref:ATP-grasp domain-containing protein n=1 Tax=Sphaerisporangium aureirubrum TaxID=1544736 RepID=A0ABW1NIM2_9ACTN
MTPQPVVAIVDAYSTARFLAPLFHERDFRTLHVQSTPEPPAIFASRYQPADFYEHIVHRGDLEETLRQVAAHGPYVVIAGAESGVELADQLSDRLGLRTNGAALSSARRDKYQMVETVKAAGVAAAEQVRATDEQTLLDWYEKVGGRVVIKPLRSALNDGVSFCDSADEVIAAFRSLAGTYTAFTQMNDGVVAQEYLRGTEYYVNSVSMDGIHYICDIWETQHLDINGVKDLLGGSVLMPRRGPEQDLLAAYAGEVLDALGVRDGGAHTELKLTPDGPRLIETGIRICGSDLPVLTGKAIGESQLEWTVDAYVDQDRFRERAIRDYEISRHATCVNMISPKSGVLAAYPRMAELEALESFDEALIRTRVGDRLHRSINDMTYSMLVHMVHEVPGVVQRDYHTARYLDGEGFYEVVN